MELGINAGLKLTTNLYQTCRLSSTSCLIKSPNSPTKRGPHNKRLFGSSVSIEPNEEGRCYKPKLSTLYIRNIEKNRNKIAIVDKDGDFLYEDVYRRSYDLAKCIRSALGDESTENKICFLCPHGISYIITQWACWMGGNVAVPLSRLQSDTVHEHIINENKPRLIVTTQDLVNKINPIINNSGKDIKLVVLDGTWRETPVKSFDISKTLPSLYPDEFYRLDRLGLILYTSGITGGVRRGVALTHHDLNKRIDGISAAWDLSANDNVLHALPLNTSYGVINALNAPLSHGGKVVLLNNFDSVRIWSHLLGIGVDSGQTHPKVNFFPSMPAIYCKLIEKHREIFNTKKMRDYVKNSSTKKIRAMTSGSSSLPQPILDKWRTITGHNIIETYISAEIGTGLSGTLTKPLLLSSLNSNVDLRVTPLPDVKTRLVRFLDADKTTYDILGEYDSSSSSSSLTNSTTNNPDETVVGELMIQSPNLVGYSNDMKNSPRKTFEDGWFLTGDIAQVDSTGGHKIIGRVNVESIQIGNNDEQIVEIREVERKLLSHPGVMDCCLVGLNDPMLNGFGGMKLVAIMILDKNHKLDKLMDYYKDKLLPHEIPSIFKVTNELPIDNSGRVDKLKIIQQVFDDQKLPLLYFPDNKL